MNLRVFTAFSGYDSQCLALERLHEDFPEFSYELVGWSEIDRYACKAHDVLFPDAADKNFGDISKIDWHSVPDFDLFTYSFPCTDISNAGSQKGLTKGSGTRSSLLWECERCIEIKRPKYLLMENVKALTSFKFLPLFNEWNRLLEGYGYTNFSQVLNAKDYGVPQNRERIFVLSILNGGGYTFPRPFELKKRLLDVLESNVDPKFFLHDDIVEKYLERTNLNLEENDTTSDYPTR